MSSENKPLILGVTVSNPTMQRAIKNFAAIKGVKLTPALLMMAERYQALTPKEKEAVEKRLEWMAQRNRGFRSLAHYAPNFPKKRKTKAHILPSAVSPAPRKTVQSSITNTGL